jgi:hypothetical protein
MVHPNVRSATRTAVRGRHPEQRIRHADVEPLPRQPHLREVVLRIQRVPALQAEPARRAATLAKASVILPNSRRRGSRASIISVLPSLRTTRAKRARSRFGSSSTDSGESPIGQLCRWFTSSSMKVRRLPSATTSILTPLYWKRILPGRLSASDCRSGCARADRSARNWRSCWKRREGAPGLRPVRPAPGQSPAPAAPRQRGRAVRPTARMRAKASCENSTSY